MNVVRSVRFGIACRSRPSRPSVAARSTLRDMRRNIESLTCCSGMSRYGMIFFAVAIVSISSSVKWIG